MRYYYLKTSSAIIRPRFLESYTILQNFVYGRAIRLKVKGVL